MDEKKLICKQLRKEFSKNGWALLLYYGIINVSIVVVAFLWAFALSMGTAFATVVTQSIVEWDLKENLLYNGWGYLLAIIIGCMLMFRWKKKEFCLKTIWKPGKTLSFGRFFAILSVFMMSQAASQVITPVLQWLFELMGFSITNSVESAGGNTDSFSMFLYVCLLAPVFEEILFRGLILRTFERYGKWFAIFTSAFLFGMFHGNLVQTPFAFLAGLVLGYVAVEYNMIWAMVLHMINNLLLGDTLYRLTGSSSDLVQQIVFAVVIWGLSIAGLVVLICKRKAIADYFRRWKTHPFCWRCFFTAPGILALCVVMIANIVLTLFL